MLPGFQRSVPLGESMGRVFDNIFRPTPKRDGRTDDQKLIGAPIKGPSLPELLSSLGKVKD